MDWKYSLNPQNFRSIHENIQENSSPNYQFCLVYCFVTHIETKMYTWFQTKERHLKSVKGILCRLFFIFMQLEGKFCVSGA